MKAVLCDICNKKVVDIKVDVCGTVYKVVVRKMVKGDKIRYKNSDICFDCLCKMLFGEMGAIKSPPKEKSGIPENIEEQIKEGIPDILKCVKDSSGDLLDGGNLPVMGA